MAEKEGERGCERKKTAQGRCMFRQTWHKEEVYICALHACATSSKPENEVKQLYYFEITTL